MQEASQGNGVLGPLGALAEPFCGHRTLAPRLYLLIHCLLSSHPPWLPLPPECGKNQQVPGEELAHRPFGAGACLWRHQDCTEEPGNASHWSLSLASPSPTETSPLPPAPIPCLLDGAVTRMLSHRVLASYVTPGVRSYLGGLSSGSLVWEQCRPTAPGVAGRSRWRLEGKGLLEGSYLPGPSWRSSSEHIPPLAACHAAGGCPVGRTSLTWGWS